MSVSRVEEARVTDSLLGITPEFVLDIRSGRYDGYAIFGISYYLLAGTLDGGRHNLNVGPRRPGEGKTEGGAPCSDARFVLSARLR